MVFSEVKNYIDEEILYTAPFDNVDEKLQKKAVKNASAVLYSIYTRFSPERKPLPIEAIAYQSIHMLAKDDSARRIDDGASYIGFNGVALTYSQRNRQISPEVIRILGRRIGSYSLTVHDTRKDIRKQ